VVAGAIIALVKYGNKFDPLAALVRSYDFFHLLFAFFFFFSIILKNICRHQVKKKKKKKKKKCRYVVVLGLMIIASEFRWMPFFTLFRFLRTWIGRGLFQLFVAGLQSEPVSQKGGALSSDTSGPTKCFPDLGNAELLIRWVPAGVLLCVGITYFVSGIFILCVLKKADPGFKSEGEEMVDAARGALAKGAKDAKAGAQVAADKGKAAAADATEKGKAAVSSARDSVSQAAASAKGQPAPAASENPFAI
jgi:hypothetical protein